MGEEFCYFAFEGNVNSFRGIFIVNFNERVDQSVKELNY